MKRYRNIKLDSDIDEDEELNFDDMDAFDAPQDEEMIPAVVVPEGTTIE
jgi:DNA-directed RNA polymerase subunit beta'